MDAKQKIVKAFKSQALHIQPDALKELQSIITEYNDHSIIDRVLQTIDKSTLKNSFVDKEAITKAFKSLVKNESAGTVEEECFKVINAFDAPRFKYNPNRKVFDLVPHERSIHGDADAKADICRERLMLLHQRALRHELLAPPVLLNEVRRRDRYEITPIESLKGNPGTKLAMITQQKEGQYYLEDLKASVPIDLSQAQASQGLYTEGCIVLASGELVGDVFRVSELGLPPAERRTDSVAAHGDVDFFGDAPHPDLLPKLQVWEKTNPHNMIVVLSDVWLDLPLVQEKLRTMFGGYEDHPPAAFILVGNFSSRPLVAGEQYALRTSMDTLATLIASHKNILATTRFVLVPGPADPCGSIINILPRAPIPQSFAQPLINKKVKVILATNPCRIRYCTQEIVIFREDIVNKMRRQCVMKPSEEEDNDPARLLVKTLCDEAHLCPLPLSVRPVSWTYDHALLLYPLPDIVFLCDKYDQYEHKYNDCVCLNPGSFPSGDYGFVAYDPTTRETEFCSLTEAEGRMDAD